MSDFGAVIICVGLVVLGCAIDNGLTNIANQLKSLATAIRNITTESGS